MTDCVETPRDREIRLLKKEVEKRKQATSIWAITYELVLALRQYGLAEDSAEVKFAMSVYDEFLTRSR